jgi:hypothetical protein
MLDAKIPVPPVVHPEIKQDAKVSRPRIIPFALAGRNVSPCAAP